MDSQGLGFTLLLISLLGKQGHSNRTIKKVLANTTNNEAAEEMFFFFLEHNELKREEVIFEANRIKEEQNAIRWDFDEDNL